jgi:hypothetical protein
MPAKWKLVTPTAYRRPRRPGRRALLAASGLALSIVVAGLAVLGSIHPTTPSSATAPRRGPAAPVTTQTSPPGTTTNPPVLPTSSRALDAYAKTYPPARQQTSGNVAPTRTPTSAVPPPPASTTTTGDDTSTMTYDSGTVVVIYPGGDGTGDGTGGHDGGHHH